MTGLVFNKNQRRRIADSHLNSNVGKLDFEDAKFADSPRSKECTLILTQGGYATHFARSGLSVLGKDKYAVFPLKGKLLNVREADAQRLLNNATIQKIIKILGLQLGNHYQDVKDLRYGHLMFMVTQGHDGSHIIGLLINFLYHHFPAILKVNKFMLMFITPMVMVLHKETNEVFTFNTISKYDKWEPRLRTEYKILGPATIASPEESKYVFADFDQHIKDFYRVDDDDDCAIKYAFGTNIDERNHYLNETDINHLCRRPQAGTDVDSTYTSIRYLDFFKTEFMQYLEADRQRSIPSIVDGFTLGQRKILSNAFKMPITQQIDVGEFSAYVFNHSPYDHGGASLVGTIVGMAQNYVGSNNINLLRPIGRFGTRLTGGKDHDKQGRFLSTQLSPITRYLFHKDEELIFKYLNDAGQSNELAWFIPIIPMVLVNGSKGSGTECSSFIPNYNPRDIIANLIRLLEGKKMLPMDPYYKGFKGKIEKKTSNEFTTEGIIEKGKHGSTITVTELPVGMWTENYEELLKAASRCGNDIKAYKDYSDYDNVHFEITMAYKMKSAKQEECFLNEFKPKTTLSTANMYLLDTDGKLKKYATPEEILENFFYYRLDLYVKRMNTLLPKLKIASGLLKNKVEFISKVRNGEILLYPLKEIDDLCAELKTIGFQSLPSIEQPVDNGEETEEKEPGTGYDYLLSIPIGSFQDEEGFKELERERDTKVRECEDLSNSTPETLWLRELKALDLQLAKEFTVKIKSGDVDPEIAEEAPKMKTPAKRRAARPQSSNKKSRRR